MANDYNDALQNLLESISGSIAPNEGLLDPTPDPTKPTKPAPSSDPLNTLKAGASWLDNARKSGPGNTMEDRVSGLNANFNSSGIKASTDAKDQLVLESTPTNVVPIGATQANVGGSVRAIIGQMQATKDPDTMRGLQSTLAEAMAVEQARINVEATNHSENKLGVPALQQALTQAESADRNDPMYRPGMGDSPITAKIRSELNTARSAADIESKRYLAGNVTFAGLQAAEKTSMIEAQRVSKLADKKEMLDARSTERRAMQQDALEEQAKGLTDQQKQNVRILDPSKAMADDVEIMQTLVKNKGNKQFIEAVQAPDTELPFLAVQGNDNAKSIILAREKALSIPEAVTKTNLAQMQEFMSTPKGLGKALALISGKGGDAAKEAKALAINLNAPKGTKEEKAAAINQKYEIARRAMDVSMTQNMMTDVAAWNSTDPILNEAIKASKTLTGKTDLINVMTSYVGDKTGKEAHDRIDTLIDLATKSARQYEGSLLGAPNYMQVKQQIISSYNNKNNWLSKITEGAQSMQNSTTQFLKDYHPIGIATTAAKKALQGDTYDGSSN